MVSDDKRTLVPLINLLHNDDDSGLRIEVDLAGASKDSVDLDMGNGGFCVKAEGEDFRYESCYMLAHEVVPEETKARFDSGLLKINVPFKDATHGHKVHIE
jgi:HSP20 family molecular chaperone IbpA